MSSVEEEAAAEDSAPGPRRLDESHVANKPSPPEVRCSFGCEANKKKEGGESAKEPNRRGAEFLEG